MDLTVVGMELPAASAFPNTTSMFPCISVIKLPVTTIFPENNLKSCEEKLVYEKISA